MLDSSYQSVRHAAHRSARVSILMGASDVTYLRQLAGQPPDSAAAVAPLQLNMPTRMVCSGHNLWVDAGPFHFPIWQWQLVVSTATQLAAIRPDQLGRWISGCSGCRQPAQPRVEPGGAAAQKRVTRVRANWRPGRFLAVAPVWHAGAAK
jgi:hypothetical protein